MIFPFVEVKEDINVNNELPTLREIAIDFKTGAPIIENKTFKVVSENEALKCWIWKALKIERFEYSIYSWNYGSEINSLIGKNYTPLLTQEELKRYIKEALEINPYIKEIEITSTQFKDGVLSANINIESVYGQTQVSI